MIYIFIMIYMYDLSYKTQVNCLDNSCHNAYCSCNK